MIWPETRVEHSGNHASVFLGNIPCVKLIWNYIRDPSGIFSIFSRVRISMTSFPVVTRFIWIKEAWRYEIYFLVSENNILLSLAALFVKCCFHHSKIHFISSRHRVISSISSYAEKGSHEIWFGTARFRNSDVRIAKGIDGKRRNLSREWNSRKPSKLIARSAEYRKTRTPEVQSRHPPALSAKFSKAWRHQRLGVAFIRSESCSTWIVTHA